MLDGAGPAWRLASGQALAYRSWDDETVLYNDLSGATHLLGPAALCLLESLRAGLAASAALASTLRLNSISTTGMKGLPLLVEVLRDPARVGRLDLDDWDLLLRQAANASLVASLGVGLAEAGLLASVPPEARRHFAWADVTLQAHQRAVRFEVDQIRRALAGLGLPLVLLRGGGLCACRTAAGTRAYFFPTSISWCRRSVSAQSRRR